MKRRYRIAVVVAFLVCATGAVMGLSALGTASEGPLSATLGWLGAATGVIEHRVRDRLRGTPRRQALVWLEPYRTSAERLRNRDVTLVGAFDGGAPRTL